METILVIDDSELNCGVIKSNLVAAGYSVMTASSGPQAIALCKERVPDLVLLDIVMPGMDGFETCRHIRALSQGADVPIVFLSALRDLESHQKALDAGGDDVLTKPIHRSELILRARSMIWLKRLRAELRSGYNLISSQRDALMRVQQQKQELIDLVVHDLKNPLTAVAGYAHHLARQPEIAKNAQTADVINQIINSAEMMERMVVNMLDISQSENGSLKPNISQVDMRKLIDESRQTMSIKAEPRQIKLKITLPPAMPTIPADASLLRRLIDNLVDNAIRYTPNKGEVAIELKDLRGNQGAFLELRVRDQGPGIPQDQRESVFEKFVRLDADKTGHYNHGLGLTFCQLAAQTHSGRIWIEDNQPKGSCFCVVIPYPDAIHESGPIVPA